MGYSLKGHKKLDMIECAHTHTQEVHGNKGEEGRTMDFDQVWDTNTKADNGQSALGDRKECGGGIVRTESQRNLTANVWKLLH